MFCTPPMSFGDDHALMVSLVGAGVGVAVGAGVGVDVGFGVCVCRSSHQSM